MAQKKKATRKASANRAGNLASRKVEKVMLEMKRGRRSTSSR